MSEIGIIWVTALGMLLVTIASILYSYGGRQYGGGKWKRRFLGSFLCASSVWVTSLLLGKFSAWFLLLYPMTLGCFTLGYGAVTVPWKIIKRSIVALASLASGILMAFVTHKFGILPFEVGFNILVIALAVVNPISAPAEEFFVCLLMWIPKLMYLL